MKLMGWLSRLKHAGGYGVHSPFAFRFIKECLEEKLPYYDYSRFRSSQERLQYRLSVFFQPAAIRAIGCANIKPAQQACPLRPLRHAPSWLGVEQTAMAIGAAGTTPDQAADALAANEILLLTDASEAAISKAKGQLDLSGHGLTFDNHHGTFIGVPYAIFPRQDFDVKF